MWPYEEEKAIFSCLFKSWLKQKCGTYVFYRIIIVVFKYSHFTFFILRKHLAPFLAGLPCCLSTCYLFKCMGKAFPPLITIEYVFPTVISGGNVFPTVKTSRNVFPTVKTSRNVFPTVISGGTCSWQLQQGETCSWQS